MGADRANRISRSQSEGSLSSSSSRLSTRKSNDSLAELKSQNAGRDTLAEFTERVLNFCDIRGEDSAQYLELTPCGENTVQCFICPDRPTIKNETKTCARHVTSQTHIQATAASLEVDREDLCKPILCPRCHKPFGSRLDSIKRHISGRPCSKLGRTESLPIIPSTAPKKTSPLRRTVTEPSITSQQSTTQSTVRHAPYALRSETQKVARSTSSADLPPAIPPSNSSHARKREHRSKPAPLVITEPRHVPTSSRMHNANHGSLPRSASLNDLPSSAASSSHGIASGSPPTPYSSQSSDFPSPVGTPTDSFPTTPVEQSPQFSFPEIMSYEDIESDATPYLYQPFIPPYYYSQCQPTYQLASYLAAQLHDLRSQLPSYADSSLSSAADELDWTSFPYH